MSQEQERVIRNTPLHEDDLSSRNYHQVLTKTRIEELLSSTTSIDWSFVIFLLKELDISSADESRCSLEDDPMGRLLLSKLLTQKAPIQVLQAVFRAYPDCVMHNPAAFFTASHYGASSEVLAEMMRHALRCHFCSTIRENECPYPFIVSDLMSPEAVQALLQVFPQGVLQKSTFLSGYSPLDYLIRSPEMMESLDAKFWRKLKLMLVAAECCTSQVVEARNVSLSPAHVLLKRLLSYPDIFDDVKVGRRALRLLQQLTMSDRWIFEKPDSDGVYPLHLALSHECRAHNQPGRIIGRELIKILLEAFPRAAEYMLNHRLPIHIAIENGWPCHDLLLALYPEALNTQDSKSDLLPFQTAALMVDSASPGLDITFELLRANPNHVRPTEFARVSAQA
eukprot:scaffold2353_cov134-Cylindrotheca_fusiformis.AAC.10